MGKASSQVEDVLPWFRQSCDADSCFSCAASFALMLHGKAPLQLTAAFSGL